MRTVPEWIADHPDQKIPPRVRARVFEKHDGRCAITKRKITPADRWQCDHILALVNGGEHREGNLQPVLCEAHKAKTREDAAIKAKNARVRNKHLGLYESRSPLPGGRGSKWKKKISGEVVER